MDIQAKLQKRIQDLRDRIAASPYTFEEAEAAAREFDDIIADGFDATPERKARLNEILGSGMLGRSNDEHLLQGLLHTAGLDLMHCTKRYVVTDTERLVSPAGFHPVERVFVQTTIAIHTDDISRVPSSNVTLYAHELDHPTY